MRVFCIFYLQYKLLIYLLIIYGTGSSGEQTEKVCMLLPCCRMFSILEKLFFHIVSFRLSRTYWMKCIPRFSVDDRNSRTKSCGEDIRVAVLEQRVRELEAMVVGAQSPSTSTAPASFIIPVIGTKGSYVIVIN